MIGKAVHLGKGSNPRFVVTNLSPRRAAAKRLYEKLYCARGEMENRIKEQQLGLFADRTSAATMRANQLRLYFASLAYVLMHGLRRLGLEGTRFARAQCTTIRLKLLKIGARLRITVRKVWLSFSERYPYASDFAEILAKLSCYPAWVRPDRRRLPSITQSRTEMAPSGPAIVEALPKSGRLLQNVVLTTKLSGVVTSNPSRCTKTTIQRVRFG